MSCNECAAGKYGTGAGAFKCDACDVGLFGDESKQISMSACKTCDSGRIAALPGSTVCELCPAGKYLKDTTGAVDLHDQLLDCKECAISKYNPFQGHSSECFECLSAKAPATKVCEGCAPGKFKVVVTNAESRCDDCEVGYYTYDRDLDACVKCPEGFHGLTSRPFARCEACKRGTFGVRDAAISEETGCQKCEAGRFNDDIGLAGSSSSDTSVPCNGCPKGKWSAQIGNTKEAACISCSTGLHGSTILGSASNTSCQKCEAGLFSEAVAAFGADTW